ncbi:hypothetical protein, partial [Verrucomicrobium spinosum]|uniref:hypothetical protein n=1 Tax=Verrucomicrobium spinosum TaxID=2736 RepID=UPI001C47C954
VAESGVARGKRGACPTGRQGRRSLQTLQRVLLTWTTTGALGGGGSNTSGWEERREPSGWVRIQKVFENSFCREDNKAGRSCRREEH